MEKKTSKVVRIEDYLERKQKKYLKMLEKIYDEHEEPMPRFVVDWGESMQKWWRGDKEDDRT